MIKLLSGKEYEQLLKNRTADTHKGSFGTAALVCGSKKYQGAAYFSVSSALHCGAGIVAALIPDCIYVPFASKISGAVIYPLESENGGICDVSINRKIIDCKADAVLCGSGIGLDNGALKAVYAVMQTDLPAVFDADALNLISKDISLISDRKNTVITPHIGEFARLCNETPEYVRKNRICLAKQFAMQTGCVVVLKDYVTVIADKTGDVYLLSRPTSALSKGGSGDVLAGMIVSFMAQGIPCIDASVYAVTLHNDCGHLCEKKYGAVYSQPENIIECISKLVKI